MGTSGSINNVKYDKIPDDLPCNLPCNLPVKIDKNKEWKIIANQLKKYNNLNLNEMKQ